MFLHTKLENRKEPIRIAFIGCGKFVSMFLAQYNHLDKIQIDSIVDLNIDRAKKNCINSGIKPSSIDEINFTNSLDDILYLFQHKQQKNHLILPIQFALILTTVDRHKP